MRTNKFIIKIDPTELVPKSTARIFYYVAFWLTVAQVGVLIWLWSHIPKVIPLFFTEPWGEARLAPKVLILLLPSLSFVSLIVNLLVSKGTKENSPLLAYTLAVSSAMIVLMFAIALAGILQSII